MSKPYLLIQHDPVAGRYYSFSKTSYANISEAQTVAKAHTNVHVVHEAYYDVLIQEWHEMNYDTVSKVVEEKFCLEDCVEEIF